ncbi:MAG: zinc transporter ZupT [Firmicutes bacterium]|nr:zinc transporter ZupT [Bacillota bacterium]
MQSRIGFALLISLLAGLATIIGGLAGLVTSEPSPRFLSAALGFSAGAMLFVSFVELLQRGIGSLGSNMTYISFFIGVLLMFLVDIFIPGAYNGWSYGTHNNFIKRKSRDKAHLTQAGILLAVGIALHNFPEGIASFAGTVQDRRLGIAIASAIALHNIPEGLAVSALIYSATGSRRSALFWTFLAGIAEPLGAALAALAIVPGLNERLINIMLSVVAGIMVFISLNELIPISYSFGKDRLSITGIILGMAAMAVSILLL